MTAITKNEPVRKKGERLFLARKRKRQELVNRMALFERRIRQLQVENTSEIPSQFRRTAVDWWEWTFDVPEEHNPYFDDPLPKSERRRAIRALQKGIRKFEKIIESYQKVEDAVGQGMPVEFLAFFERQFRMGDFVLIPGRVLKRIYSRVGLFDRYENETLFYERGEYSKDAKCYGSAELKVVCGPVVKFVRVREVTSCRYTGVFATPALCSHHKIEPLTALTLSELRRMAADL
jgi:hypothetical protein